MTSATGTDDPPEGAGARGVPPVIEAMISRIANSNCRLKNQQIGEPDLTTDEKHVFVKGVFTNNPAAFLSRFWKALLPEDMQNFVDSVADYELQFYRCQVASLHQPARERSSRNLVRNRRYNAIKGLTAEGYFSDDSMMQRNPLMYQQMVGQYLTEEERNEQIKARQRELDGRISNVLMNCIDNEAMQRTKDYELDLEEGAMEEEEDDEEEEDEEKEEEEGDGDEEVDKNYKRSPSTLDQREKDMLKSEFLHVMHERFLSGSDVDFDYSTIDSNTDYDDLQTIGRDEEDKYFDEEEPFSFRQKLSASGITCTDDDDDDD
ncbi:PREDICTED: coiled-coil domain-containing protein 97-like, partial [Priapulus caudatus]|uniref:Coiled-coil domain-containing protein 97-like n=1 Tax=Priapulus caudatus TaxID=37621 RepID=A0ABM1EFB9_PRICU